MRRFTLEGHSVALDFRLAFPSAGIKELKEVELKCNFNFSESICPWIDTVNDKGIDSVNDKVSYETSGMSKRARSLTANACASWASTSKASVLTFVLVL
jgi:hypothetical protein